MANKNTNKRKLGKLTEKQKHFIKLFVNGYPLEHILTDLEIEEWEIVSYMSHNPVFLSALNSALFLKEQSLYINNLVVRIKALELLEKFIEAGLTTSKSITQKTVREIEDLTDLSKKEISNVKKISQCLVLIEVVWQKSKEKVTRNSENAVANVYIDKAKINSKQTEMV